MKHNALFASFLILLSCAQVAPAPKSERTPASVARFNNWAQWLNHEFGPINNLFIDPQALQAWKVSSEFGADGRQLPPSKVKEVPLLCGDQLYPTNPLTLTKDYIYGIESQYAYGFGKPLSGRSDACIASNSSKTYCLNAQRAMLVIMSDTYEDKCGNLYRGYFVKHYRKGGRPSQDEDNMGTLVAPGRTVYQKSNSFKGDFYAGQTNPVSADTFVFFSELWPGDKAKINEARNGASKMGYRYSVKEKLFFPPPGLK